MVIFLVNPGANAQSNQRVSSRQQMKLQRGDRRINDNLSKITDIQINGVQKEQILNRLTVTINCIKDSRYPHD